MTKVPAPEDASRLASRPLVELLAKALVDSALRQKLFADPEAVARSQGLSPAEIEALKKLDRQKFERAAAVVRWN